MTTATTSLFTKRVLGRAVVACLGMTSVVPLLAWVYGLGPFHVWFWAVAVPGMGALAVIAAWVSIRHRGSEMHRIISVGFFAGILGTIGYDLFRVPFVYIGGLRLLSPIDSYGVLLLDASTSSGLTDFAGWAYHFANGVGFAITYAAVALGRHWLWGVAWAMILETATIVTPFVSAYQLEGKFDIIAIAYAAHVPYGLALGLLVQRDEKVFRMLHESVRQPGLILLGGLVVVLTLWHQPWSSDRPEGLASSDTAGIVGERMQPEFVRLHPGDCFVLRNLDDVEYQLAQADDLPLAPGAAETVCVPLDGVIRFRVTGEPFDGGFLMFDPFAAQSTAG